MHNVKVEKISKFDRVPFRVVRGVTGYGVGSLEELAVSNPRISDLSYLYVGSSKEIPSDPGRNALPAQCFAAYSRVLRCHTIGRRKSMDQITN